jgi:hypothetical protein
MTLTIPFNPNETDVKLNTKVFEYDGPEWAASVVLTKKELVDLLGQITADRNSFRNRRLGYIEQWKDAEDFEEKLKNYDKNIDFYVERADYITNEINKQYGS